MSRVGPDPFQAWNMNAVWPIQAAPSAAIFGHPTPMVVLQPPCAQACLPVASVGLQGGFSPPEAPKGAEKPAGPLPGRTQSKRDGVLGSHPRKHPKASGDTGPAGVLAKTTTKKERVYDDEAFRSMLGEVLRGASAMKASALWPTAESSLKRYARQIRADQTLQRGSPEATLEAQLQYAAGLTLKQKGNKEITSRRIFDEAELDYFASSLKLFADMGWPMDYQQVQHMFLQAATDMGFVDWKTGKAGVSKSYCRRFVKSREELKAYKTSNIDPLRSKKATEQVCYSS